MEFYRITDVQPVKDMAPHVHETVVKLPYVGDESIGSVHGFDVAAVLLLWTLVHQPAGSCSSQHD